MAYRGLGPYAPPPAGAPVPVHQRVDTALGPEYHVQKPVQVKQVPQPMPKQQPEILQTVQAPKTQRQAGEKEGLQRGMLGGWYSDPAEQQGLKKTASVRVDTALGPEYHVQQPVAVPMQVQQQAPRPGVQTAAPTQLARSGMPLPTLWSRAGNSKTAVGLWVR